MKKLLLIDGNSILNRAFYGVPTLTTRDGLYTNAVHGMLTILLKQLDAVKPDFAAVAFDVKAPTFRHRTYDGYKANRKGMPEELAMQLPFAKEAMRGLGLAVVELPGYEADDLLGTYATLGALDGLHVYLLTGDKDSLQLISDQVTVLLVGNKETTPFDSVKFFEKYGVRPDQFVDVKALMGDSSDNIPGVAGIGEKTACKLIAAHETLDGVYAALPDMKPSAQKDKLTAGRENAYLSQFLARICTTAPVPTPLADTVYSGLCTDILLALCRKLEFTSLIERLSLADSTDAAESETPPYTPMDVAALPTLDTAAVTTVWWDGANESLYVACGETRAVVRATFGDLLPFLSDNRRRIACADSKTLHRLCIAHGARFAASAFDLSLAAYLLSPTDNDYSPVRLAGIYLARTPSTPEAICDCLAALVDILHKKLIDSNMFDLFSQIEMPTAEVLAAMEENGFCVDTAGLVAFGKQLVADAAALADSIYLAAGRPFNILSPKQLGEVLFEHLGLPCEKKTKTGYSTNAEVLEKLRPYHPIVDMILEYRTLTKLASTYAEGLVAAADAHGIIHSTFHQTVTATGRLSSSEPNLQNIPIRTKLGREFRRYFIPRDKDYVLVDADYSQIELRLLAHLAGDEAMCAAFSRGADIHTATAAQVFGVPEEGVTPEQRKRAKAVNFGIVYGIGAYSLAQDLGVSKKQADSYMQSYFATYSGIKVYLDAVVQFAKEKGYVATPFGRRRAVPELASPKAMLRAFGERVAMNSPVQGMAADVMKLAMVNVHRALAASGLRARIVLQVHDELILEVHCEDAQAAAALLQREMEGAARLAVPLVAETTIGDTWYDCK